MKLPNGQPGWIFIPAGGTFKPDPNKPGLWDIYDDKGNLDMQVEPNSGKPPACYSSMITDILLAFLANQGNGQDNNENLGTASATTDNSPSSADGTVYPGMWVGTLGFNGQPVTVESATTSFVNDDDSSYDIASSDVTTTWQVESNSVVFYATVTFPQYGEYGWYLTVTTNEGTRVLEDPGHDFVVIEEKPLIVTPVNFTIPAGGSYSGPLATFTQQGVDEPASEYQATLGLTTEDIEPGPGNSYTVYGTVTAADLNPDGSSSVYVRVDNDYVAEGDTPEGDSSGANDAVDMTAAGQAQSWTTLLTPVIQVNSSDPTQQPLAIIDTTDPTITSASQVSVSVGDAANTGMAVPLVTGTTLTQLGGGLTQIVVNGLVNSPEAGAEPLSITLGSEPTLTAQVQVEESASDYTVNPVPVTASAGQPLQNVQVATVTGPADGNYTATINWGDDETSSGEIIALSAGQYSVIGSKPQPYADAVNKTITVTVNGPGTRPAPAAETPAMVSANPLPPTVTLVSPLAGPTSGGTVVTITGANLGTASTATVLFGSTPATILSDNGTTIQAISPPGLAGSVNVTVTTAGRTSVVTSAAQFTYLGPAVTFQVSPPASETAGTAFSVTVTAEDASGNTVAGYNGSVLLYSSDGQKVLGSAVNLVHGVGTAQVTLDVADPVELVAVSGGIYGVSGLTTVQAATPSIVQLYAPTVVQAGAAFAVTVVARDQFGNGCTGLVSLTTSDGQGGTPTWVSLVNGVGTALVTFDKADTLTLKASLNGIAGTSNTITVYPGGLASLAVSAPSTATTKTAISVQVTALDAFGNTVTGFSGPVALLSSDGQPVSPSVVTLTNGVGTAQVTLNRADPTALIADYYGILGSSNTIQVSGPSTGPAVTFQVSPPASETAGTAFSVTVTAKDAHGNTTGYNGSVILYSSDGQQVSNSSVTLTQGVGTAQVTLNVADQIELVAVGGGIYGVSGLTTIHAATPSSIQVYAPAGVQAGAAFAVTVMAKDQYGNGCTGLVSLTTSDGQGGTPTWVSLVNGVGTALVTLDKADTLTLKANLNGTVGQSNSITVYPGGLTSFAVSAPSTATTGTAFSVQVTALDAFGNTVTGFSGPVALLSSDGQAGSPSVVTLTNGVGTAQVTLTKADPTGLIADYYGILGSSGTIQVSSTSTPASAGPAVTFQVSPPASETAGSSFSVKVTAKDASGNTVTSYNGTVTLYSSDGQKVSGSSVTLVNGVGTAQVTLDVADQSNWWPLAAASTG